MMSRIEFEAHERASALADGYGTAVSRRTPAQRELAILDRWDPAAEDQGRFFV